MSQSDFPLRRIDHVRFFVGNARQSAYFYRNAFGFDVIAYAGLETKSKHEAGYVLRQGNITFVLASPLSPNHPEAQRVVQRERCPICLALWLDIEQHPGLIRACLHLRHLSIPLLDPAIRHREFLPFNNILADRCRAHPIRFRFPVGHRNLRFRLTLCRRHQLRCVRL